MRQIDIKTTDSLLDLEQHVRTLECVQAGEEVTVRLARWPKMHLFKESRISALLMTASQRGKLVVQDWHNEWADKDREQYLRQSVASFSAVTCASRLTNEKGAAPPFSLQGLCDDVASDGGILEPHNVSLAGAEMVGKTLTFCALDPVSPEPIVLSGLLYEKQKFIDKFLGLKAKCFKEASDSRDRTLASYIFELYQNGFEHGRLSDDDAVVKGLRFLCIRRHVALNRSQLVTYAAGFPQLVEYIEKFATTTPKLHFYEVSVSDQGAGIVQRFLSKRQDFAKEAQSHGERLRLLKRLLLEGLTSKVESSGAGFGLERALAAIRELSGFVSLRTDAFWLSAGFADGIASAPAGLFEVRPEISLARVAGTHFNALIPLRGE